jgi:hypothetical protein
MPEQKSKALWHGEPKSRFRFPSRRKQNRLEWENLPRQDGSVSDGGTLGKGLGGKPASLQHRH